MKKWRKILRGALFNNLECSVFNTFLFIGQNYSKLNCFKQSQLCFVHPPFLPLYLTTLLLKHFGLGSTVIDILVLWSLGIWRFFFLHATLEMRQNIEIVFQNITSVKKLKYLSSIVVFQPFKCIILYTTLW